MSFGNEQVQRLAEAAGVAPSTAWRWLAGGEVRRASAAALSRAWTQLGWSAPARPAAISNVGGTFA